MGGGLECKENEIPFGMAVAIRAPARMRMVVNFILDA
jgi:hypothetical protein